MRALAKLNLSLSVGPALTDGPKQGFHPIASLFACIDLADDVDLVPGPASLDLAWAADAPRPTPIDWDASRDLAFRALLALEAHLARSLGVGVRVRKRIPVGGGLAGGSSDAAAVLLEANHTLGLALPASTLRGIAAGLGSDVAYFLDAAVPPRPAIVTGLGERVERVELDPRDRSDVLLIIPPFACPTGDVYRAFDRAPTACVDEARVRRADIDDLFNDLLTPAELVRPALARLRADATQAAGFAVHMTGSGSCLFVLVQSHHAGAHASADACADRVRRALPDCVVVRTRLVSCPSA